jgi:mono/diheme cytochrome c family protein
MKKLLVLGIAMMAVAALSARAADGKAMFDKDCAMCHGQDGKGQTRIGQKLGVKDFTDAKVQSDLTDAAATKGIKEGVKDADGKTVMKAFSNLSDDDVKGLVAYIRTFKK